MHTTHVDGGFPPLVVVSSLVPSDDRPLNLSCSSVLESQFLKAQRNFARTPPPFVNELFVNEKNAALPDKKKKKKNSLPVRARARKNQGNTPKKAKKKVAGASQKARFCS